MNFNFEEYIWPAQSELQPADTNASWSSWSLKHALGMTFVASFMQNQYMFNSVRLMVLGTAIETGRRLFYWVIDRFKFQYRVTARFDEGDPSYDWILLFLTERKVWRRSQEFIVNAKNSRRKWGIETSMPKLQGHAEYVPTYELPQLFRWKGYWIEVKRNKSWDSYSFSDYNPPNNATIYISIYTLDMSVISVLVEEARDLFKERSLPNVAIYSAGDSGYGRSSVWSNVKNKARRPLSSIILLEGVIKSLVQDVEEFMASEEWYLDAGIPYRRGYLLYGPPGTGKSSTIYALAGELGLEIYSLSLASSAVDDSFLQKAAASIPKHSIFLIEDIDCAFPPREDADSVYLVPETYRVNSMGLRSRGMVTLSGLLNVLDGVGSEEGKLFFATTNYIDRLDAALLRPGRIDRKVQYFLATQAQASALFMRFYGRPPSKGSSLATEDKENVTTLSTEPPSVDLPMLASQFASKIPTHTFSTAELQGYLLLHKKAPEDAVGGVGGWVESELGERLENARKERERRERVMQERLRQERLRREFDHGWVPTAGPGPNPWGVNDGGVGVPQLPPSPTVSEVSPEIAPEYSEEVQGGNLGPLTQPTMPPPPFSYPGSPMEMGVDGSAEGME